LNANDKRKFFENADAISNSLIFYQMGN